MVHDQSYRQGSGVAARLRSVFGDLYSPQLGLDPWWEEGLAVYDETKLPGMGRLWTKYVDGLFAAGLQAVPALNGGYLHAGQREVFSGAPYLVGARFVDYLSRTYGEKRLWQVIESQSNALLFTRYFASSSRCSYSLGCSNC